MADNGGNIVALTVRFDWALHDELEELVRAKRKQRIKTNINSEILDAVRQKLQNSKGIQSLQTSTLRDKMHPVPSVTVLGQGDAASINSGSDTDSPADSLREVERLRRTAEAAERDTGKPGSHGKGVGDRKRRAGGDAT